MKTSIIIGALAFLAYLPPSFAQTDDELRAAFEACSDPAKQNTNRTSTKPPLPLFKAEWSGCFDVIKEVQARRLAKEQAGRRSQDDKADADAIARAASKLKKD